MINKCPSCGAPITDNICEYCGTAINKPVPIDERIPLWYLQAQIESTQRIMRGIVLWGISMLIAFLMAIITIVVACGTDSYDTISFVEETKEEK